MLDSGRTRSRFHEAHSKWIRRLSVADVKCLIVCRGRVRREAITVFVEWGIAGYGRLLSEKDSIVYPKCLAPELRDFRFPENVHRVPDYMGQSADERRARMDEIVEIATSHGYTHVFTGYGFMAEDAEFLEAVEAAGLHPIGPASSVARRAGAKDEAKKLARSLGVSVTPGIDNVAALALLREVGDRAALERRARTHDLDFRYDETESLEENAETLLQSSYGRGVDVVSMDALKRETEIRCGEVWAENPGRRIRLKHIGGGGGKGQRIVRQASEIADAVGEVCAESKALTPGSNRNFLIELNVERTRHNEIQLIGNGTWCLSLGGRDCSVQMHEQKLLELSLTRELLEAEIAAARQTDPARAALLEADARMLTEMEEEGERFGEAVGLDSVSTFELIVEGDRHYFMEMNTRIQVEHRVTEMAYALKFANPKHARDHFYVESLIEAMVLLAVHGAELPRPARVVRHLAGGEVRINATDQSLQPHAGGIIYSWSPPRSDELRDDQGIGTLNPDTGAFVSYNVAGAYDSNIALVVTHGDSRRDNLERLWDILRRTEIRGYEIQTNLSVHYGLLSWILGHDPMLKPTTRFMEAYLAAVGSLAEIVRDVDLGAVWDHVMGEQPASEARAVLALKETLLLRPLRQLLADAHLLAGFIGLHHGRLWQAAGDDFGFIVNPIEVLRALYHYLDMEADASRPPSSQIWDHDDEMLQAATDFYAELARRGADANLEDACRAADAGFQLGMKILLVIPRIARAAGFLDIRVGGDLEPVCPERYTDPTGAAELAKYLSPPPPASSDEIVTPMGGHFYARETPDAAPFVQRGDHFEKGDPLFIVEVMKMFNRVLAPFSGTITDLLLPDADGRIVVKGEPIFKIEPDQVHEGESRDVIEARRHAVTRSVLGLPAH